jgi:ankyrin repeat protein
MALNDKLTAACRLASADKAAYLLDSGADPFEWNVKGNSSIHIASMSNAKSVVDMLLSRHSSLVHHPNRQCVHPVQMAANHGHVDVIQVFVKHGFSIDTLVND